MHHEGRKQTRRSTKSEPKEKNQGQASQYREPWDAQELVQTRLFAEARPWGLDRGLRTSRGPGRNASGDERPEAGASLLACFFRF